VTNPDTIDALSAAFAEIAANAGTPSPEEADLVRRQVYAVVDELKAGGALPERILIRIKKLAGDAGLAWNGSRLLDQIVNWTIERFYALPDADSASSAAARRADSKAPPQ
jgi:hypothetical protein